MPYIHSRYESLLLLDDYLKDPLLLALAWKKSHEYIRSINWYADNFELDKSALNLEFLSKDWSEELSGDINFSPLKLVPAPKTSAWGFSQNKCPSGLEMLDLSLDEIEENCYCVKWAPKEPDKIKLRPLAHIGVKEQTYLTLVMMCLANDVETLQGDPATDYKEVHDKKVVSYGNRLYCTYTEEGCAEHNFGATTIYGKYFTDYRKFLQRPYHFASKTLSEISSDEEVYLVELDLTQFFDLVNRKKLVQKIIELSKEHGESESNRRSVTSLLEAFEGWEWSENTIDAYEVCETEYVPAPPKGLPQGLVAAGFLSNIYMLDFDSLLSEFIGKKITSDKSEIELKLVDYCRYVDDMRLVVIGPSREKNRRESPIPAIKTLLKEFLKPELAEFNLKLNIDKTKVEIYRGKSKGISATLEDIQTRGSGPVSYEDADELIGQLESLLMLSGGSGEDLDQNVGNCRINRLALIENNVFDVREDTLKRFAANKLSRMLNNIRHFTSRDVDESGNSVVGDWDYLQERIARRLVACWSHDPALVLLLKKGLELFPSPKLLGPVIEQLEYVLNKSGSSDIQQRKQSAVARYCLAEVFRHSAMIIHRKDPQSIPAHADIDSYFERLQDCAARLIDLAVGAKAKSDKAVKVSDRPSDQPDFDLLIDQARFLLMTRLDTVLERPCGNEDQDLIFKLAKGFRYIVINPKKTTRSIATCILIANQLISDQKPLLRAVSSLLDLIDGKVKRIIEKIALQEPRLVKALFLHARPLSYAWYKKRKNSFIKDISDKLYIFVRPSAKPLSEINEPVALYKLSSRSDNPFSNEIVALKLMLSLIDKSSDINSASKKEIIDLSRTKVALLKANAAIGYSIPPSYETFEARFDIKDVMFSESLQGLSVHLLESGSDSSILQKIALAMRALLSGSSDPTGFGQLFTPRPGYRGIKSTSFKRQFGMMTTPESLVGENAQFSGWLTTLLAKLLRWPGIHVNDQGFDWPIALTLVAVKKLIEDRLVVLKKNYCQLSRMPGLPELITPKWDEGKRSLTVAMVQSKLPFKSDFSSEGIYLDTPQYRVKHRRHVARVAQLIIKHIEAQSVELRNNGKREQDIDLIVLPELSVHRDDIAILVQLSRKTKAIIFAGLSFINQTGIKGPNNCAIWIVPRKHGGNSNEVFRYQGKFHMMEGERKIDIQPWRPYQLMLELKHPKFKDKPGFILTGSICFDATDICLSADLRDKSNAFIVPALNRDVSSFDTMVEALHYHMYQPVILVNTGEFGGSYAMAPYKEQYKRLIAHSTGNNQVAINTFEMNMFDFRRDGVGKSMTSGDETKTPPAGIPHK